MANVHSMTAKLPGLVAISFVLVTSCSPKQVPTAPAAVSWSWDAYPAVRKMQLAVVSCQVLPKTSLIFNAPVSGRLRLYIDQPQTNLPAGFIWAEFEPKVLKMEGDELAEARRRVEEHERLFAQIELPKEKIKVRKQITDAKLQVALLALLETNRELARLAVKTANLAHGSSSEATTLHDAQEELALLEANLDYLTTTNPAAILGVDLQGARMELERRQLEFDRRQAQSRFQMPFNGSLYSSLQVADGVIEYPVVAGQELAVARDLSGVMLRVPLGDVSWSSLPTEKLTAVLRRPDGTTLEARFAYKKVERQALREEVFYYFQFPPEVTGDAGQLVGTDAVCELRVDLSQPACVVPKLTLVMRDPAAFQSRHWNEGVARVLPGAQLLLEGQTDLAILPPANKRIADNTRTLRVHVRDAQE